MAYRYEQKQVETPVIVGASCDHCSGEMVQVDGANFSDALHIRLAGGYGEYFDDNPVNLIFCKACADALCHDVTTIGKGIREAGTYPELESTPNPPEAA